MDEADGHIPDLIADAKRRLMLANQRSIVYLLEEQESFWPVEFEN